MKDKRVLKLIRAYLESGVMLNGVVMETEEGHTARWAAVAVALEHHAGRSGQGVGEAWAPVCALRGRLQHLCEKERAGERVMESVKGFWRRS